MYKMVLKINSSLGGLANLINGHQTIKKERRKLIIERNSGKNTAAPIKGSN